MPTEDVNENDDAKARPRALLGLFGRCTPAVLSLNLATGPIPRSRWVIQLLGDGDGSDFIPVGLLSEANLSPSGKPVPGTAEHSP